MADEDDYGSEGDISEDIDQDISEDSRAGSMESDDEEEEQAEEGEDIVEDREIYDEEEEEEEQPKSKKKEKEPKQRKARVKPWIVEKEQKNIVTDPKKAYYKPKIENFEKATLLGARAVLLDKSLDEPALTEEEMADLENRGKLTAMGIATEEYNLGVLPMYLHRYLPDGTIEIWPFKLLERELTL